MGKNNKKRNKVKPAETASNQAEANGEIAQLENHESALQDNDQKENPGDAESHKFGLQEPNLELERRLVDEKRQADFEKELSSLKDEIHIFIQKEGNLEKQIEQLQNENDSFTLKEASLERKFELMQSDIDSWISKEASFVERIKTLEDEKETRFLHENSMKDSICELENANSRLQKQVKELEESRGCLVLEKQQLMKSISLLEFRVQHLEDVASFLGSRDSEKTKILHENGIGVNQLHADGRLIEDFVEKTEEIVNKVDEPHNGLDVYDASLENNLVAELDTAKPPENGTMHGNHLSENDASMGNELETIPIDDADEIKDVAASHEEIRNVDILQLPLDEIQIQEVDSQPAFVEENSGIPLSDAPLIGAPFRLISFVAKYVSGADLVKESNSKSGR